MTSDEVISLYESVAQLTDQMLAAARANDWELLASLEEQSGTYIATLRNLEDHVQLSEQHRNRKVEIIRKVLEDDRDIRNLTEPGLRRLSALIQSNQTEQKLLNTYGMGG
ncbi:flagellar protein FliT [Herbaspirillum sp. alder98]|uniref:flagellar protein FliT n=1 Tax=Herbaspirillum sp. alder98 TaxID=2913096 RepID=UPI001CD8BD5B|nr:flagellar protein FliT [Herbaspirillum sp. alder98]MCA1322583.1 flagellar protein FliT [Herbaspirillum sp. alder98]